MEFQISLSDVLDIRIRVAFIHARVCELGEGRGGLIDLNFMITLCTAYYAGGYFRRGKEFE